jgi:hypothetical protein
VPAGSRADKRGCRRRLETRHDSQHLVRWAGSRSPPQRDPARTACARSRLGWHDDAVASTTRVRVPS